jgi:hypothetical protein
VSGPAGVLALVLAESAAGGALFLWLAPLWGRVRRGFFILTGSVILLLALAAAGSASSARDPVGPTLPPTLALVLAGLTAAWLVLLLLRAESPARWTGLATVPLSVAMIVSFASSSTGSTGVAVFQLMAGAAFMGAVIDGLLLGHWYLVDRKLSRDPIDWFAVSLLVAVVLETVAVAMEGFGNVEASPRFSSLLSAAGVASYLALGMVLATALIAVMIRLTLRGTRPSAVQAATGFFYLAVITAFAGELAAKIRFLPR